MLNTMSAIPNQQNVKTCSRCEFVGDVDKFINNRNICKSCENKAKRDKRVAYSATLQEGTKKCTTCLLEFSIDNFTFNRGDCASCKNKKRRDKYKYIPDLREQYIKQSSDYKKKKTEERVKQRAYARKELDAQIGEDNAICKYCGIVRGKSRFRHNRLKCRECERDDPHARLIRVTRVRILDCLHRKTEHLVEYLGCGSHQYKKWLEFSNPEYVIGSGEWHIDHVIPVSKFDIDNKDNHMIMFNWRNTMPLIARENLVKNNKIIPIQIKQHILKLDEFHAQNNIEFPNIFRELFAKHLDAGSPLEPSLPLPNGNI